MNAHVAIPPHKMMRSKLLLGTSFAGDSWDTWEAVIKAAYALPLSDDERATFNTIAGGRSPPTKQVKELVCVVGRRGGKDSVAALLATHAAVSFNPRGKLRPGEYVYVCCVACDRDQAGLVFRYIKGNFEAVPAFAKMIVDSDSDTITLTNRVIIQVTTNSFRSVRGRSILCAIFDEVALFRSDESANPDVELAAAVRPSLALFPNSMMILISTAYKRSGLLYERFKDNFGKDDDDVLVVKGTTREFNNLFPQAEIDKDLARDPAKFASEYLSEWRDDLSAFIDRALVEAATDIGVVVRAPQRGVRYVSFVDASGGRGDSFTCSIAHAEGQTSVLDSLIEIRSPFDPDIATRDIAIVLNSYGLSKTTADHYAAGWTVSAFARNNVKLEHSERNRSEIYLDALPLFTSGRVKLIDNQRLAAQFYGLERRTFPSGQDKVNHPPGGHDDCCNAVAGALVLATERKSMVISKEVLAAAMLPTAYTRAHAGMHRSARVQRTRLSP